MNQKTNHSTVINSQSSLQKLCKLQKKISAYIQRQSTFDINSETQGTKLSAQKIPQKFIGQNKIISSHKKINTNKKFDWLTKNVRNSRQSRSSSKLLSEKSSIRQSFSNLKKNRCKTDALVSKAHFFSTQVDFLSGQNQNRDKPNHKHSIHDTFENSFTKQNRPQTPQKSRLINQENSLQLLKEIQVNKKILIKSQSFQLKQFKTITDKENAYQTGQDKQNLKKVLSNENRKKSFVKRKKILQSENKNQRNLQEKQKSSKFLLSGFNPKDFIEEGNFFDTISDQKFSFEGFEQQRTKKCIKNLKKEYICLSKESRKMHFECMKRSKKNEQEIKVEPWNFFKQENEEDYEVIRLQ